MFLNTCMKYIDISKSCTKYILSDLSEIGKKLPCILGILDTCGYAQTVELLFKWHTLKYVTSTSLLQLDVTRVWGQDNTGVEIPRH